MDMVWHDKKKKNKPAVAFMVETGAVKNMSGNRQKTVASAILGIHGYELHRSFPQHKGWWPMR